MSEKSKLDTKKDDVPENFFLASKKDGHQMTVYYSQAACAVLEEWKKQGKGTKNQFISDAIVEYGMARFGEELGEAFSTRKLKCLSKPQDLIPKEVVAALALALLDGRSFKQKFSTLCEKITAEDVEKLSGKTAKSIGIALAKNTTSATLSQKRLSGHLPFGLPKKDGLMMLRTREARPSDFGRILRGTPFFF